MSNFNATTKEVMAKLLLKDSKTLFRRRTDYNDPRSQNLTTFLKPGVHFRFKSPGCTNALLWDLEATINAWETAVQIAEAQR